MQEKNRDGKCDWCTQHIFHHRWNFFEVSRPTSFYRFPESTIMTFLFFSPISLWTSPILKFWQSLSKISSRKRKKFFTRLSRELENNKLSLMELENNLKLLQFWVNIVFDIFRASGLLAVGEVCNWRKTLLIAHSKPFFSKLLTCDT